MNKAIMRSGWKQAIVPPLPALLLLLSACGTTPHTQYYLLTPAATSLSATEITSEQQRLLVSIDPVTLPEYLDRSQIVTRRGATELDLADSHRWAEPLQENFSRVLAEDLQARLGAGKVTVLPTREYSEINYRVTVNVTRFDASDQGEVLLIAAWSLYDGKHTRLLDSGRAEYHETINRDDGYPEMVGALSQTIHQLSGDIYNAITGIQR